MIRVASNSFSHLACLILDMASKSSSYRTTHHVTLVQTYLLPSKHGEQILPKVTAHCLQQRCCWPVSHFILHPSIASQLTSFLVTVSCPIDPVKLSSSRASNRKSTSMNQQKPIQNFSPSCPSTWASFLSVQTQRRPPAP